MTKRRKQPKKNPHSKETPLVVPGTRLETEVRRRPLRLARFRSRCLRWLPSYRNTQPGRSAATQFRLVAGGVALFLVGFGTDGWHALVGAVLFASILVLPVNRDWKKGRLARLQKGRVETRVTARTPVSAEYDGRRVAVVAGESTWRRVLVDRRAHTFDERALDDRACLGVLPDGGRRAERIWICAQGVVPDTLALELEDTDFDAVVELSDADFEKFRAELYRWVK